MPVIVGAGGYARQVVEICDRLGKSVIGFLVDPQYGHVGQTVIEEYKGEALKVIGDVTYAGPGKFVIAIGDPVSRLHVYERILMERKEVMWETLVDPSIMTGRNVKFDDGSIISARSIFTSNISVGKHVQINLMCLISHDSRIADFVTVAPGVFVAGNVDIGEGTYLGIRAVVLEKIRIGSWAKVGAGAVVTEDVPDNATVVGVPAKLVRQREPEWWRNQG